MKTTITIEVMFDPDDYAAWAGCMKSEAKKNATEAFKNAIRECVVVNEGMGVEVV